MDAFRWNGIDADLVTNSDCWDWFLNGIDSRRIRATLIQFPLHDSFDFDATPAATKLASNRNAPIDDENDSADNMETDNQLQVEDSSEVDESDQCVQEESDHGSTWRGEGPDIRFSPSCILPMILGSLESGLLEPAGSSSVNRNVIDVGGTEQDTIIPHKDSFAMIARRLCGKGALSLTLAALCSRCLRIRKLAMSILGLFLAALHTDEAREDSSWRERPQLAMVVNAVQRALSLMKGRRRDISPDDVPMFPVFVALFLARSSLTMSSPEDSLYVPLNRFFLKTEEDHGAFQDTNRLPGFISLFCSSSDDHEQARRERLWAVQLLENGCLDSHSYRLAAACHAPELILTTIGNFRALDCEGNESSMLLQAVATFITCGGRRAISHLIGRLGLLSWLRSISMACLPMTPKSITSFLKLVSVAVKKAAGLESLRCETLMEEIYALVPPVVKSFFLYSTQNASKTRIGHQEYSLSAQLVSDTLDAMQEATRRLKMSSIRSNIFYANGVSLKLTVQFLKNFPRELVHSACSSLSYFPVRYTSSHLEDAREYCKIMLGFGIRETASINEVGSALERFNVLSGFFGEPFDPDGRFLRVLISNSRLFLKTVSIRELWLHSLSLLVINNAGCESETVSIARSLVETGRLDARMQE